jgi:hypothetical protein
MKWTARLSLTIAVFAAVAMFAPAVKPHFTALPVVHAQSGCNNATLTGNYGLIWSGFATPAHSTTGNEVPWAGAGVVTLDGAGNFSASWTTALNGKIFTDQTGAGTYAVNSNCTGSLSFTSGDAADFTANLVIIGSGTEVFATSTNAGNTLAFDFKKQ